MACVIIFIVIPLFCTSLQGKLPLTNIAVRRLEDTESIKNAFEIQGTLIEAIVAVCQGPTEADKWVDLLTKNLLDKRRTGGTGTLDHQKRNVSTSESTNLPTATISGLQSHVNIALIGVVNHSFISFPRSKLSF